MEQIIQKYNKDLYKIIFKILKDEHYTEDCLQQTYMNILKNMDKFKNKSNIKTWIVRIAINCALQHLKNIETNVSSIDFTENIFEDRYDYIKDIEIKNMYNVVKECIDKLKSKYKEVLVLKYFEDKSLKEIADNYNVSRTCVKQRLSRGKKFIENTIN